MYSDVLLKLATDVSVFLVSFRYLLRCSWWVVGTKVCGNVKQYVITWSELVPIIVTMVFAQASRSNL